MAINLFGFEINRKKGGSQETLQPQITMPSNDDGAITVSTGTTTAGGYFGTNLDKGAR